jgi:hypothetical protein
MVAALLGSGAVSRQPDVRCRADTRDPRGARPRNGYVHIPGVLSPDEVAYYRASSSRSPRSTSTRSSGSCMRSAPPTCIRADGSRRRPRLLGVLAGALTPNIHIYHSHIDVHPPEEDTGQRLALARGRRSPDRGPRLPRAPVGQARLVAQRLRRGGLRQPRGDPRQQPLDRAACRARPGRLRRERSRCLPRPVT